MNYEKHVLKLHSKIGKTYGKFVLVLTHPKHFITNTKYRFTSDWFYDFSMLILIASTIKMPLIIKIPIGGWKTREIYVRMYGNRKRRL